MGGEAADRVTEDAPWSGESGVVSDPGLVESARHVGRHVDEQRIEGLNEPIKR